MEIGLASGGGPFSGPPPELPELCLLQAAVVISTAAITN